MADNIEITAGTGTPIATDEIGGSHYQRVKLTDGTPESTYSAIVTQAGEIKSIMSDLSVAIGSLLRSITRPIWYGQSNNALRTESIAGTLTTVGTVTTVTGVTTVSTVTTVGAVTSLNQLNSVSVKDTLIDPQLRQVWALCVRGRIS